MKTILLILPLLALTSCETLKNVATPENIGRALIIAEEAREIYKSANPILSEK